MKRLLSLLLIFSALPLCAFERQALWPEGKMPNAQPHQIAAMKNVSSDHEFNPDEWRMPYLEWFEKPTNPNGCCMILISGGGYNNLSNTDLIDKWHKELTAKGVQCVNLVYRTPRPKSLPVYQSAWEDGQRAVRLVRSQAKKRGFNSEKIGVIGMSAGSHLALLLATSSETPAYESIDKLDDLSCHINWAVANAPAYVTTDGARGPASRQGYGPDVTISKVFKFDGHTCPISLHHGGVDPYSPNGSTLVYRELRKRKVPAELHLYPNKSHGAFGFERAVEFMTQMGYLGPVKPEEKLMDRYASDEDRAGYKKEAIWPEGKMPDRQENQCEPYIEWHFPHQLQTHAIQIIYSGGSYTGNDPDGFEVAPIRRYLNSLGITVVTLKYRTPRPAAPLAKHTTAWQDLQRAIRVVRSEAPSHGLDPNRIGIMGSSAGGHLTLMGVTSSRHKSYYPIDNIDKLSCKVQWGIGIYPAYALEGNSDWSKNMPGGNEDSDALVPEFTFDLDTAPMLFIHGDADSWPAMNSVKVWEKMRAMGIQSELHTLALRPHCFQRTASPGTGSYTWMERIAEYIQPFINE